MAMTWLELIGYTGTFVFAITGALKARNHHMDIFGAAVLAFATAYGGGTIRDLLIGVRPVNWVNDRVALGLVLAAVTLVFLFHRRVLRFQITIFLTDAIGLGLFTALGVSKSFAAGLQPSYAIMMGVISATFGGLLADILSNEVPDLLKKGELYATASLIGGLVQWQMISFGFSEQITLLVCVVLVLLVRIVSKWKRIYLPEI
jgi:uncharacterized membrane protein YeiH